MFTRPSSSSHFIFTAGKRAGASLDQSGVWLAFPFAWLFPRLGTAAAIIWRAVVTEQTLRVCDEVEETRVRARGMSLVFESCWKDANLSGNAAVFVMGGREAKHFGSVGHVSHADALLRGTISTAPPCLSQHSHVDWFLNEFYSPELVFNARHSLRTHEPLHSCFKTIMK